MEESDAKRIVESFTVSVEPKAVTPTSKVEKEAKAQEGSIAAEPKAAATKAAGRPRPQNRNFKSRTRRRVPKQRLNVVKIMVNVETKIKDRTIGKRQSKSWFQDRRNDNRNNRNRQNDNRRDNRNHFQNRQEASKSQPTGPRV